MEAQRYKELDDICKEMEKQMARNIQETLEMYCKVIVDYSVIHNAFSCVAEIGFYDTTISSYSTIPAKELRNVTQDMFKGICDEYAGAMATALKDFMARCENEIKGGIKC